MGRETIEERQARLRPGAEWIRAERERRSWSGRELARRMDVAQDRISAYERAQDEPPVEFARALAKVFDLPEIVVWRGLGKPLPERLAIEEMSGPEIVEYVRRRYPGELEKILGDVASGADLAAPRTRRKRTRGEQKTNDVTRPGESGRSASLA